MRSVSISQSGDIAKGVCFVSDSKDPSDKGGEPRIIKLPKSPLIRDTRTRSEFEAEIEPAHVVPPKPPSEAAPAVSRAVHIVERPKPQPATALREEAAPPVVAAPPQPAEIPAVRKVRVEFERFAPPSEDELTWVVTPVLGSQARVFRLEDGSRVRFAGYAAAMVLSFAEEAGVTTVLVRSRFHIDPGEEWSNKLKSRKGERLEQFRAALTYGFERVALSVGLVARLAGGPPMSEEDARVSGYDAWDSPNRAPVVAAFTRDYIDARNSELQTLFLQTQFRWDGKLRAKWWSWFNKPKFDKYELGGQLAKTVSREMSASVSRGVNPCSAEGKKVAAAAAKLASPVMQSLVSRIWFGSNPHLRAALLEKGIPCGDERGTRMGTMNESDSLYGTDPKIRR